MNSKYTYDVIKMSPLSKKFHYYFFKNRKRKKKKKKKELEFCNLFFFNGTYERYVMAGVQIRANYVLMST